MYVCMCMCVCVRVRACVYVCMCVCMYVSMYVFMYVCVYKYVCMYVTVSLSRLALLHRVSGLVALQVDASRVIIVEVDDIQLASPAQSLLWSQSCC